MGTLSTSQLAKKAHVNPETLRYYIRRGLIAEPDRSSSGYRQYPAETVTRIQFIKNAQELGFTLEEVKDLLALRIDSKTACQKTARAVHLKIEGVKEKIARLQRILHTLERMETTCAANRTQTGCPILECLNQEEKPW